MIKYDEGKLNRIDIFNNTMNLINTNESIKNSMERSKEGTILISEDLLLNDSFKKDKIGNISIINSRTFAASNTFNNIAVLNFASATRPGGGVKTGSNAQEECLCRCSTLYPCLAQVSLFDTYYKYHRDRKDIMYTNKVIYTPNVLVFKSDIAKPLLMEEKDWYQVNVITCAAPNLKDVNKVNNNELYKLYKSRIKQILHVAIINHNENIVLGAFGCGAFKNDPFLVARAFKEVLIDEGYNLYFDNVIFAVLVTSGDNGNTNYLTFERTFKNYTK